MKRTSLLASCLLTAALLAGCGKDKETMPDYDGTVTWTHNGQTYTSKAYASAIVDSPTKLIITAAPDGDNSKVVSLVLYNLDTKGAGNYDLARGSTLSDLSQAALTLDGAAGQGAMYNTLYGPAASNGTIVVTKYDKAAQKLEGTFSYTGGAVAYTAASGTQSVTNGSFSFRKFH